MLLKIGLKHEQIMVTLILSILAGIMIFLIGFRIDFIALPRVRCRYRSAEQEAAKLTKTREGARV